MRLLASFRLALAISVLSMPVMGCKQQAAPDPKRDMLTSARLVLDHWRATSIKDEMTDEVLYATTVADEAGNRFSITCYPRSHTYTFSSGLLLAATKATGEVEYRFDHEKETKATALLLNRDAIVGTPLPYGTAVKRDDPIGIMAVSGAEFEAGLILSSFDRQKQKSKPATMTVRMSSVDGQSSTFRLDITGIDKAIHDLNRRCGFKA